MKKPLPKGAIILFWTFVIVVLVMFVSSMSQASEKFPGVGVLQEHAMYDTWSPIPQEHKDNFNSVGQWCDYTATATYEIYESEAIVFDPETGMLEVSKVMGEFNFNVKATYEFCYGNSQEVPPGNFEELKKTLPVDSYFNPETDIADHWVWSVDKVSDANPKLIATCVSDLNMTTGFIALESADFAVVQKAEGKVLMEEVLYLHVASRDCTLVEPAVEKDPLDIPPTEI